MGALHAIAAGVGVAEGVGVGVATGVGLGVGPVEDPPPHPAKAMQMDSASALTYFIWRDYSIREGSTSRMLEAPAPRWPYTMNPRLFGNRLMLGNTVARSPGATPNQEARVAPY